MTLSNLAIVCPSRRIRLSAFQLLPPSARQFPFTFPANLFPMAVFSSKRYTPSARGGSNGNASLNKIIRRNPILFGGPFLFLIVGGSFALQSFTQTRYDLYNSKTNQVRRKTVLESIVCSVGLLMVGMFWIDVCGRGRSN